MVVERAEVDLVDAQWMRSHWPFAFRISTAHAAPHLADASWSLRVRPVLAERSEIGPRTEATS